MTSSGVKILDSRAREIVAISRYPDAKVQRHQDFRSLQDASFQQSGNREELKIPTYQDIKIVLVHSRLEIQDSGTVTNS